MYPVISVTVDIVIFTVRDGQLCTLLVERDVPPFRGAWALPGGYVQEDESLRAAAERELVEETNVQVRWMEQLAAFGAVDRDPRGRVVTIAFTALVDAGPLEPKGGTDAADAQWFVMDALPDVAFDHAEILELALTTLRERVDTHPIAFQLLPDRFTLSDLQQVHEAVLGQPIDKRNFRRRVDQLGLVEATDETVRRGPHRPARLYRYLRVPKRSES